MTLTSAGQPTILSSLRTNAQMLTVMPMMTRTVLLLATIAQIMSSHSAVEHEKEDHGCHGLPSHEKEKYLRIKVLVCRAFERV